MTSTFGNYTKLGFCVAVMGILLAMALSAGSSIPKEHLAEHSNGVERVTQAAMVTACYDKHICESVLAWYSPKIGTVIILCGIPDSNEYGGMSWRVTEYRNGGIQFLETPYMVTVILGTKEYWNNYLVKNEFVMLLYYPHVGRFMRDTLGMYW